METFELAPVLWWFLFLLANAVALVDGGLVLLRCRVQERCGLAPARFDQLRYLEAETWTLMERGSS